MLFLKIIYFIKRLLTAVALVVSVPLNYGFWIFYSLKISQIWSGLECRAQSYGARKIGPRWIDLDKVDRLGQTKH